MEQCKICKTQSGNFTCGHGCGSLYCSEQCANHDWKVKGHFLACGDYLDQLPAEVLFNVLMSLQLEYLVQVVKVNLKLQSIVESKYFQQQYVRVHQDISEWEEQITFWLFEKNNKHLTMWILVLPEGVLQNLSPNIVRRLINFASLNGNVDILRSLTKYPNIEQFRWDAFLAYASQRGHLNVVEFIVHETRLNANLNTRDALKTAVLNNYFDIVKVLVPLSTPSDIVRAIDEAVLNRNSELISYLLSAKSFSPNELKSLDYTVLLFKARRPEESNLIHDFLQRRRSREMGEESETKRTKIGQKMTQK